MKCLLLLLWIPFVCAFAQEPSPTPEPSIEPTNAPSPTPTPGLAGTAQDSTKEPQVARPVFVNEREIITQLQIFLDQQKFGPGKIDGRGGEFTTKALRRYQLVAGLPVTGEVDQNIPLDSVYPIYTTYEILPRDKKFVGDAPTKPSEQAKKKYMPYRSLLEFVTERFHTDPELLKTLNPGMNLENLKPGDVVRVPNVEEFKLENVQEIAKLPEIPEFKNRTIHIDTKERLLDVLEDGKLLHTFPITPGSSSLPAPAGNWKILGIVTMPWFRHDEKVLNEGVRSNDFHNIPAGPNNPVGVLWMGLSKPGIGIHGTNNPQTIGRAGSHGCIRLANWDAIRVAYMVTKGITVTIK